VLGWLEIESREIVRLYAAGRCGVSGRRHDPERKRPCGEHGLGIRGDSGVAWAAAVNGPASRGGFGGELGSRGRGPPLWFRRRGRRAWSQLRVRCAAAISGAASARSGAHSRLASQRALKVARCVVAVGLAGPPARLQLLIPSLCVCCSRRR